MNLQREFNRWFFDEAYPDLGSNRAKVYSYGNPQNAENRDYWMRQAFEQGAKAMFAEVNQMLIAWAIAAEGLEPEMLEPCEVYDRARENLHRHVQQLKLFE